METVIRICRTCLIFFVVQPSLGLSLSCVICLTFQFIKPLSQSEMIQLVTKSSLEEEQYQKKTLKLLKRIRQYLDCLIMFMAFKKFKGLFFLNIYDREILFHSY